MPPATNDGDAPGGSGENPLLILTRGWRDAAAADLRVIRADIDALFSSLSIASPSQATAELSLSRITPKLLELRRGYAPPRNRLAVGPTTAHPVSKPALLRSLWLKAKEDRKEIVKVSQEEEGKEWEVVKLFKEGLRELEKKTELTEFSEVFKGLSSSEFVKKVKLGLKSFVKEPLESKEVPPLHLVEIFADFVRQSEPLLDQLGVKRELCDKVVETLCGWRKASPDASLVRNESIHDELDLRIAGVLQSTGHHLEDGFWRDPSRYESLDNKRHVAIVTTASLPWMTGTAVNPLFRAAYLSKSTKQNVTLVVPWLCKSDQQLVYPNGVTFCSPEEQESYIRNWLEERLGFKADFKITFYPGKFSKERRSIIPAGDTSQFISSKEADIAILEEPEHLNWYHHGRRWTDKFNHVIGVVHTNYLEYIKREKNGALQAFLVKHINNWVTRAYCHKVLRLSAATQDLPKSVVCNVHGVNPKFLKVGEKIAAQRESGQRAFSKGAYFLGKMVWAKGYRELIDMLSKHKNDLDGFKLDVYGTGEDSQEVQDAARNLDLNLNFFNGRDHADDSIHGYRVFVNPSISDVLCTATAEALAMGKFVVCADHPSNDFFKSFPNCLTYKTSEEFVSRVKEAMSSEPQPLTPEQRYSLSWEAATRRFMEHSELERVLSGDACGNPPRGKSSNKAITSAEKPFLSEAVDGGLAFLHYCLTGSEILRLATGAIPGTRDYDEQQSADLNLLPPQVQHPVYNW